ncbi:MAG: Ger(x)C family spore germination protein [Bacillota bacterium]
MNKTKQKRSMLFYSLTIVLLVLITGCSRYKVVDQINIVDIMGFGYNGTEGNLLGSVLVHEYREGKDKDYVRLISSSGKNATESLTNINQKSPYILEIAKTRVLVLGEEYTKEVGIGDIVSSICRDAKIGTTMKIVISDEPLPLLFKKLAKEEGDYLPNLIEQNMIYHNTPYSNLHIFLYDFYGKGRNAIIPFISLSKDGEIIIEKMAVIGSDRKLKMILDREQTTLMKLYLDKSKELFFTIPIEKDNQKGTITIKSVYGRSKTIPTVSDSSIKYFLSIKSVLIDYPTWINLKNEFPFLEKETEKYINQKVQDLFNQFKENDVDPLGIGDDFRSQDKHWKEEDFYKSVYPFVTMKTKITANIFQSGVGDDGNE